MSTLWRKSADKHWHAEAIESSTEAPPLESRPFRLVPFDEGNNRNVALILSDSHQGWVNGNTIIGLKVLDHRDEIHIAGRRWYYSSESQPRRAIFQLDPNTRRPRCVVCRVPIEDGDTIVACPRCGRLYHQLEAGDERPDKPCYTYRDRCLCGHATSLDGEGLWRPDEEERDD